MEGYVYKWVNFIKGWKPRYLLLEDDFLYFSKSKNDINRKKVDLNNARVIDEKKKKHFIIERGDSKVYIKASSEEEKKVWIVKLMETMSGRTRVSNVFDKRSEISAITLSNNNVEDIFVKKDSVCQNISERPSTNSYSVEKDDNVEIEKIVDHFQKTEKKMSPSKNKKFSFSYNLYYNEINKNKNKADFSKLDLIINNYQNITNLFFEFSTEMENFNLILKSNFKSKSKEELRRIYQSLINIKQEMKEQLDNTLHNLVEFKEDYEKQSKKSSESNVNKNSRDFIPEDAINVIRPKNETFYCAKEDEELKKEDKIDSNMEKGNLINPISEVEVGKIASNNRNLELTDNYFENEENDSSFEDCVSLPDVNNKELDAEFHQSFGDSILRESDKINARFSRSLSTVQSDFYNISYQFEERASLPCVIKCSNSMVVDMLKSLTKEKVTLPIYYNEPLSMLQRQCEKFQYSDLLFKAANSDLALKLCYTAAFLVAELSLNINRILKPFNPILGETFEYFDNKKKYRYLSEQVSHHPPISAFICESEDFAVFGDTRCKSQFKLLKRAVELVFTNKTNIIYKNTKEHIIYNKPTLFLKGLIMGSPHYDFSGSVNIEEANDKEIRAVLDFFEEGRKYKPLGYFEGKVLDSKDKVIYLIGGNWTSHVYIADKDGLNKQEIWRITDDSVISNTDLVNNYLISSFACNLNFLPEERDSNLKIKLPPTDSRLRPDQRAYEMQDLDLAEKEKNRIEQNQRNRHKEFEKEKIKYEPSYFAEVLDSRTGDYVYLHKGDYWSDRKNNNFSHLYNIFS